MSGTPEWQKKQKQKPRRQHLSVQALRIFCFMELRPQVFSLCKHFAILFSWNSGRAQCFQPVRALHSLIFTNPRHMFSATASDFYLHVSPVPTTWDFISFHRFIYRDSSPSYTAHFRKPALNQRPLWMKSCELKFLLTSCWILWKKCCWMKTGDPSLSPTLRLKIQLWMKPWAWRLAKLFPPKKVKRNKKHLIGWIPALVFRPKNEILWLTFLGLWPKPSVGQNQALQP